MSRTLTNTRALAGIIAGLLICISAIGPAQDKQPKQAKPTELPSLGKAREVGRSKSKLLSAQTPTSTGPPQANVAEFRKHVGPLLTKNCLACHGPKKSERDFRIDKLDPDLLKGQDIKWWLEVYDVLSNGEMPPEEAKVQLSDAEVTRVVEWLGQEIQKASRVRPDEGSHTSFRRMTRYEYNYALQDLLGLPYSLADKLPPETASEDGFKNSSEMLQMSAMQFQTYRQIGLKALRRATVRGERPKPVTYVISMKEEMKKASSKKAQFFDRDDKGQRRGTHLFNRETGKGLRFGRRNTWAPPPDGVAGNAPPVSPVVLSLPRNSELKLNLNRFLPDDGIMRVSIRAARSTMSKNEYASIRLIFSAHTSNNANFAQEISERDIPVTAPAGKPEFIHFDIPLSDIQRNPFRKLKRTFPRRDEFLHIRNVSNANNRKDSLHVEVDYIEISAPHYDQWPPKTHTDVFIASNNRSNEKVYAREVLTRFMERAWRRSVSAKEVDPFLSLFNKYRPDLATFEDAMLEVLATVLATPEFLYLTHRSSVTQSKDEKTISDVELASRLSFFLWSSIPDGELLDLARKGELKQAKILNAQVQRMLADPRAKRLSRHFVKQWLGLDGLKSVTHIGDKSLAQAMSEEPIAFFEEVLSRNSSVMDFLHSDYAVVNERLAQHYRISDVFGPHFRKVPIKTEANRGGILTSGAILAMNSDGKDSHPLKRGIWLLERILHDPPPLPPPNVPEVDLTDPKILQMTLKERIVDHRNKAACRSCHSKIDPWGIAFENYDALGAYRTKIKNRPVDATAALFNKQQLAGIDGLKRYLLTHRQDQFAKAMVHKMTAYALGRPLSFSDRTDIDNLTVQFRKSGDRLGDLVTLIINSNLFRAKRN